MKLPEGVRKFFQQQGRIGAAKRYARMSAEQRRELARWAAETRWKNAKGQSKNTRSKPEEKQ